MGTCKQCLQAWFNTDHCNPVVVVVDIAFVLVNVILLFSRCPCSRRRRRRNQERVTAINYKH